MKKFRFNILPLLMFMGVMGAGSAAAGENGLNLDPSLNLLTFGNFVVPSADVEGRVAVGGNAKINAYSINTPVRDNSAPALIVAKNLEFTNGSIYGNTVVGGNFTSSYSGSIQGNVSVAGTLNAANGVSASSVTTYGAVNGYQNWYPAHTTASGSLNLGFDFAAQQTRLNLLSSSIDSYATTGAATLNYSTLVFNATNSNGLNVFDIQAADAAMNMQMTGLGATGTVLINVHGNIVNFGNHGFTGFDSARGRILFNLVEATQVSAGYVEGSVLAPKATFTGNGGVIWGQVVTNNWESSTQVNNAPFIGSIPVPAVPEPETVSMLLAGLGLLAATARRRKAN